MRVSALNTSGRKQRRWSDGYLRNRNREDYQPAGARNSALAAAVEHNRVAAKPCIQKAVSGRESVFAFGDQIRFAFLANHEAGKRAWRIGA
jgi:hypothetical protein